MISQARLGTYNVSCVWTIVKTINSLYHYLSAQHINDFFFRFIIATSPSRLERKCRSQTPACAVRIYID